MSTLNARGDHVLEANLQGQNEGDEEKAHGVEVHRQAGPSQVPSACQQRLSAETFQRDAADGDHVREHQGGIRNGQDGVQRDIRALVTGQHSFEFEVKATWVFVGAPHLRS